MATRCDFYERGAATERTLSFSSIRGKCVATNDLCNYGSKRWQHPMVVSRCADRSSNRKSHPAVYWTSGMEY
ncbi:hypothetical protein CDAR_187771 [Caerostris darwini]|uniref:Uncharacterized protein n=1 Tax=Caerostris darwini TaxID=1538125 RepID=A0AAV4N9C9_9ARAC|nr:hypothetical protein CDAR_187771 [Caerostris darwini]